MRVSAWSLDINITISPSVVLIAAKRDRISSSNSVTMLKVTTPIVGQRVTRAYDAQRAHVACQAGRA